MNSRTLKVLVVDDHPMLRRGLVLYLQTDPAIGACFEAATVVAALTVLEREQIDVALVDITLSPHASDGLGLVRRIRDEHPRCRAIVLSMHSEELYGARARGGGAKQYLSKLCSSEEILTAVKDAGGGALEAGGEAAEGAVLPAELAQLSTREFDVFRCIGRGMPPRLIAETLSLSVKTVETHRGNIRRKLAIATASDLQQYAVSCKLS